MNSYVCVVSSSATDSVPLGIESVYGTFASMPDAEEARKTLQARFRQYHVFIRILLSV